MTLDQANPNDFDAVLLPGGAMNADALRMEKKAQEFVRNIDRSGQADRRDLSRPVAADLRAAGERPPHDQLLDHPGRPEERRRQLDRRGSVRDRNWVSSRQPYGHSAVQQSNMIELFSEAAEDAQGRLRQHSTIRRSRCCERAFRYAPTPNINFVPRSITAYDDEQDLSLGIERPQAADLAFRIRDYRAADFERLWQIDQLCFRARHRLHADGAERLHHASAMPSPGG